MFLIGEQDFYVMIAAIFLLFIWFLLTIIKAKGYIVAKIKEMLGRGKVVLIEGRDGIARWKNKKTDSGFLVDKTSQTQIAIGKLVRTEEGNFFVISEGFGLSYDIPIATAVEFLERNGFRNIVEALKDYDDNYFSKKENIEKLDAAIKEDAKEKTNLRVKKIMQDARSKLLNLDIEWLSDTTIPLFLTYKWALQNIDSVNNKNITDREVIAARKENLNQGWSQEKITFFIVAVIGIIIVGAIGFYIVSLAGGGSVNVNLPNVGNGTGI